MKRLCLLAALCVGSLIGPEAMAQPAEETPVTDAKEGGASAEGDADKGDADEGDADEGDDGQPDEGAEGEGKASGDEVEAARQEAERKAAEEAERKAAEEAKLKAEREAAQDAEATDESDPSALGDDDFMPLKDLDASVLEEVTIRRAYPYIEHNGMFRFRADLFANLDLNTTGTSPILPPPERFPVAEGASTPKGDAERYGSANIRFRYTPIFHVAEGMYVTVQMDIPDNLILGSIPDGATLNPNAPGRTDLELQIFSDGQNAPTERTAFRLKQAFGTVEFFLGEVRVGRMANHWGLGMLANGGQCMDCDFGDFVDRAQVVTRLPAFTFQGLYAMAAWDYAGEGPVDFNANQGFGQPRDISQLDDVDQLTFALYAKPVTESEQAAQQKRLRELRLPALNAGAWFVWRRQEAASPNFIIDQSTEDRSNLPALQARSAELYIPDLWLQFLWEPKVDRRIRIELEASAVFGSVDFIGAPEGQIVNDDEAVIDCFGANANASECQELNRDVRQFGLALESEFQVADFATLGFDAGFATGRRGQGFGVNDAQYRENNGASLGQDTAPNNFRFDRDYFVDMILFREIIGTVTNASYYKPWVEFRFLTRNEDSMGFRFASIYSAAHRAEATPGGRRGLGLEFNSMLFYEEKERYRVDFSYGLLVPLGAFDEVAGRPRLPFPGIDSDIFLDSDARDAEAAQTAQFRMFWFF